MIRGGTSTSSTSRPPRALRAKAVRSTIRPMRLRVAQVDVPERAVATLDDGADTRRAPGRRRARGRAPARGREDPSGRPARSPARARSGSRPSRSAREASRRAHPAATPSTVTPETDADGPALAVSRTTGRTVSTPGTASKRASGAAWRTGTSALRFSRTTTSAGTAYAAWSCSPVESVERYAAARDASASASARKAAAVPAAPGDRASETPASRAPRAPPPRASARPRPAADVRPRRRRRTRRGRAGRGARPPQCRPRRARPAAPRRSRGRRAPPARQRPRRRRSRRSSARLRRRPRRPPRSRRRPTTAVPRPSRRPVGERRLSVSTSQTGAPDAAATIAPAMMPDHPADDRAAEADGGALGPGQERPLPRLRAVPGEPPPRGREIASHGARREDGEGDEERRRLAADEQQPPAGDGRGALRFAQLLRRQARRDQEDESACSVARARSASGEEPVDLPEPRRPCLQRLHPAVAPIRPGEDGRRDEARDALGHDERCGGGPVVPSRSAAERGATSASARARCRSGRGSRRRAAASGGPRSRPARSAGRGRRGACPCRAGGAPRSDPAGRCAAAGRFAARRTA